MEREAKTAGEHATMSPPGDFGTKDSQVGFHHKYTQECHHGSHDGSFCRERCMRICTFGHQCKGICGLDCEPCQEPRTRFISRCSHKCTAPCSKWYGYIERECRQKCEEPLGCGHLCQNPCNDPCGPCSEETEETCTRCGEIYMLRCSSKYQCKAPLGCDHVGIRTCFNCKEKAAQQSCTEVCNKLLPCGHRCKGLCGICREGGCSSECYEKCLLRCSHDTQCSERCNDVCKFEEKLSRCQWGCERHSLCTTNCGQICTFTKCDISCKKDVKCLICDQIWKCHGLCGQCCPPLCNECKLIEFKMQVKELSTPGCYIKMKTKLVELEDCFHILPVDYMDSWVDGHKHKLPILCPFDDCKKPVLNTARYVSITRGYKWKLDEGRHPCQTDSSRRSSQEVSSLRNQETGQLQAFDGSRHSVGDNYRGRSGGGGRTEPCIRGKKQGKGFTSCGAGNQIRNDQESREEPGTSDSVQAPRSHPLHRHSMTLCEGRRIQSYEDLEYFTN